MSSGFQPKQLTKYEASHLAELQGNASETAVNFSLSLIPPFKEGDRIHDNACGAGAVTQCIMATPPAGIHINATDINPQFVTGCAEIARQQSWPVEAQVMDAKDLQFPNDTFTHSFTSFAFHCMGDAVPAASQIYRTLKPGGTAVASIWVDMPHANALKHAHWRTRGRDGPMPVLLEDEEYLQEDLQTALQAGGFETSKIALHEKNCYVAIPDLKRWAQLAWSYLGTLPSGWNQEDEDKWEEAVEEIADQMKISRGVSRNENGDLAMKIVACVAIATK